MDTIFSDYFSRRANIFTRMDARVKISLCVAAIIAILISGALYVPLIFLIAAMIFLGAIRIPAKILLLRMTAPLGIGLTMLCIKIFLCHDRIDSGLLLVSKIVSSTSMTLFLSMTTPMDKILAACLWFKVPAVWVEICLIAYRYIFVLLEDALIILDAQKVRLGYANMRCALRSLGILAGAVVIRAYDQSMATYEAMALRGYKSD